MAKRTIKSPDNRDMEIDEPDDAPEIIPAPPVAEVKMEVPPPEMLPGIERGEVNTLYAGETDPAQVIKARNIQRVYEQMGIAPGNALVPSFIESLNPSEVEAGAPDDFELVITGTGFTPGSVIVFNGNDEPTTINSDTEVTTGVKPSLFVVAAVCPVMVRGAAGETSNSVDFTFTEPMARKTARKKGSEE